MSREFSSTEKEALNAFKDRADELAKPLVEAMLTDSKRGVDPLVDKIIEVADGLVAAGACVAALNILVAIAFEAHDVSFVLARSTTPLYHQLLNAAMGLDESN